MNIDNTRSRLTATTTKPVDRPQPQPALAKQGAQVNLTVTHETVKRLHRRNWPLSIRRAFLTTRG